MKTTLQKSMNLIGFKELRENSEKYIKRVGRGETFTILRRTKPIFKIVPMDHDEESGWETIADFTHINPAGVPADQVLRAIKKMHG